jgi:hypothetical protein
MREFLELQVAARNEVNEAGNELGEKLRDFFAARMGQKVIKVTPYRRFTAKVKSELGPIARLDSKEMSIVFDTSCEYSVYATLTNRFSHGGRSHFQRYMIYVCSLRDLCVVEFKRCEAQRTDFTVEEIIEKRKRIAELDREISELKGSIRDFERY